MHVIDHTDLDVQGHSKLVPKRVCVCSYGWEFCEEIVLMKCYWITSVSSVMSQHYNTVGTVCLQCVFNRFVKVRKSRDASFRPLTGMVCLTVAFQSVSASIQCHCVLTLIFFNSCFCCLYGLLKRQLYQKCCFKPVWFSFFCRILSRTLRSQTTSDPTDFHCIKVMQLLNSFSFLGELSLSFCFCFATHCRVDAVVRMLL